MMRHSGGAPTALTKTVLTKTVLTATVLTATALAVTACGPSSYNSGGAGGAYGGSTATSTATSSATPNSAYGAAGAQTSALKVMRTSAGTVLASSRGLTLYYYTEDKPGSGKSVCTGSCASAWPPLTAPVRAPAGVRLPGPLGMITRSGGTAQVTINGYPIYFYAGDKAPGQAAGNGIGGAWHVIKMGSPAKTDALEVVRTKAGTVLANPRGLTLYYYSEDKPGSGKSVCTGSCASTWPPVVSPVLAPAGVRLPGPLGTITRPGGVKQVTLNGYPLYRYAGDKASGQDTGNGIGGAWHVIKIA
jgi:predicted lipoprotein with Yx(FWY)xxD motif